MGSVSCLLPRVFDGVFSGLLMQMLPAAAARQKLGAAVSRSLLFILGAAAYKENRPQSRAFMSGLGRGKRIEKDKC